MDKFIENHCVSTPKAILDQCIEEVNEELLVLDFSHFQYTKEENDELDLHMKVAERHDTVCFYCGEIQQKVFATFDIIFHI